jgi:cation diffusion facilitator CzcD-associated flavoprotein CzcO
VDHYGANPITKKETIYTCQFIFCSYYNYTKGYQPEFKDESLSRIIHPQQWPKDLAVANKKNLVLVVALLR